MYENIFRFINRFIQPSYYLIILIVSIVFFVKEKDNYKAYRYLYLLGVVLLSFCFGILCIFKGMLVITKPKSVLKNYYIQLGALQIILSVIFFKYYQDDNKDGMKNSGIAWGSFLLICSANNFKEILIIRKLNINNTLIPLIQVILGSMIVVHSKFLKNKKKYVDA